MSVKVLAGLAFALLFVVVPARPAHACSCGEPDPTTAVTLDITASRVEIRPGDGDEIWGVVDLRGKDVAVVGAVPALLDGVAIDTVPVLSSVILDPSDGASDSCNTPRPPAAGADLRVTGHASQDDGGLVIWTGPCSGTFEVTAAPVAVHLDNGVSGTSGRNAAHVAIAVGGVGLFALGVGLVWRRRSSV